MIARCCGMHRPLVFALLVLSACSPSPYFAGAEAGRFETDGMVFTVYRRADEVEVHRSGGGIPKKSRVLLGAITAIEGVTGCPVRPRSMNGGRSVVVAEIDCGV